MISVFFFIFSLDYVHVLFHFCSLNLVPWLSQQPITYALFIFPTGSVSTFLRFSSNWFTNKRKRHWTPVIKKRTRSPRDFFEVRFHAPFIVFRYRTASSRKSRRSGVDKRISQRPAWRSTPPQASRMEQSGPCNLDSNNSIVLRDGT